MGWLDKIERVHFFKCKACGEKLGIKCVTFDREKETPTLACGECEVVGKLEYTGWGNAKEFHKWRCYELAK